MAALPGAAAAATITVSNKNDSGSGSLRAAITSANTTAGADLIRFQIGGSGVRTIALASLLPVITETVTIDGATVSGYTNTPLIEIDCGNFPTGLVVSGGAAQNSELRALVLNGFGAQGILIDGAPGAIVRGCYLGTNAAGTVAGGGPGLRIGLEVRAANNVTIGGLGAADRCLASGNAVGIKASNSSNLTVRNTLVGTDVSGALALPNTGDGLVLTDCVDARIGHDTVAGRVVVSGNGGHGIRLNGIQLLQTRNHLIYGCHVGVNLAGTAALGNALDGVRIEEQGNQIGGLEAGYGNVISGNGGAGVRAAPTRGVANWIRGNRVGLNAAGTAAIPNGSGIVIEAPRNIVGAIGGGNVISGSLGDGLRITSTNTRVAGNRIGTDAAGTLARPNASNGISILGPGNRIGGNDPGEENVISGNGASGVEIVGAQAVGNVVDRARIGMDLSGNVAIGNGFDGVRVVDAAQNVIGSTGTDQGNVISGNAGAGVALIGTSAVQNQVIGNRIGARADGSDPPGNGSAGIYVNANGNQIGNDFGGANEIAGSGGAGVQIAGGANNVIVNNAIHGNLGLGIDLLPIGTNDCDSLDLDLGPNESQNAPRLLFALPSGALLTIGGELKSQPLATYRVQIFGATECSEAGSGQGRYLLGETMVTTNALGTGGVYWTFSGALPSNFFVANATDAYGNTSEFSACIELGDIITTDVEGRSTTRLLPAPTPFPHGGTLRFVLVAAGHVSLDLIDVRGRRVATLADREFDAGEHRIALGKERLAPGVYWARFRAGSAIEQTQRIVKID